MVFGPLGKGVGKNPFGTHPTFSAKAGIGAKSTYLPPYREGLLTYVGGFSRDRGIYSHTGRVFNTFSSTEKAAKPQNPADLPTYLW